MGNTINFHEIFLSINGEINNIHQGALTTFIRFSGCNLRCSYCDTKETQKIGGGKDFHVTDIIEIAERLDKGRNVIITGGEPLIQYNGLHGLVERLKHKPRNIVVETNGTTPIPTNWNVDCWVVDFKMPCSGMFDTMQESLFVPLRNRDFVKFVVGAEEEVEQALNIALSLAKKGCRAGFIVSPMIKVNHQRVFPNVVAKEFLSLFSQEKYTLIADRTAFGLQIHKYVGAA